MLWTIIVILIILWLLGFFGRSINPGFPQTGGWIHTLIVIAVILIILHLLGIILDPHFVGHRRGGQTDRLFMQRIIKADCWLYLPSLWF